MKNQVFNYTIKWHEQVDNKCPKIMIFSTYCNLLEVPIRLQPGHVGHYLSFPGAIHLNEASCLLKREKLTHKEHSYYAQIFKLAPFSCVDKEFHFSIHDLFCNPKPTPAAVPHSLNICISAHVVSMSYEKMGMSTSLIEAVEKHCVGNILKSVYEDQC